MFILAFVVIGIIGILTHLGVSKKTRTPARTLEVILLWALIINGLIGIFAFFGHVFNAPTVARSIGWPVGSPFQFEIGIANLGMGVLGLMCIWQRGNFWLAAIVMMSIFGLGAGYGHIDQIVRFQNYAPGNAGIILYFDLINPFILFGLYFVYHAALRREVRPKPERLRQAA